MSANIDNTYADTDTSVKGRYHLILAFQPYQSDCRHYYTLIYLYVYSTCLNSSMLRQDEKIKDFNRENESLNLFLNEMITHRLLLALTLLMENGPGR